MALNDTLKTRILLRNDALTAWNNSELVLAKGELAIATGIDGSLAEVRVGNNSKWANSLKLRIEATQISGLLDTIDTEISGKANVYQIVANGDTPNSWKLQTKAISSDAWTDVGSAFTVDFSALTADIDALSRKIDATNAALNTVSSDYVKATDFAALSNDIGLSAASSSNKVVTQKDIADLAGAMHFRGAVTPSGGRSDAEAIAAAITNPAAGDIVIVTTTSKEYVYNGSSWVELGDEVLYATKAEVASVSADLTADIAGLAGKIDATNATLNTVSSDYLKAADKTELTTLVGTVSSETLVSAKNYTDEAVAALSIDDYIKHGEVVQSDLSGYFIFDCGGASLRANEPEA